MEPLADAPKVEQIAACQTIAAANALFKRIRDAGGLDAAAKAALTERSAQIR